MVGVKKSRCPEVKKWGYTLFDAGTIPSKCNASDWPGIAESPKSSLKSSTSNNLSRFRT